MARTAPDWPRMMRRATAAAYCDMTTAEFEREMAASTLPLPVQMASGARWSRTLLDEHLERLSGERTPDWRATAKHYAQK